MRERAYILLEGDNDIRFYSSILYPLLSMKYRIIHPWRYQKVKKEITSKFIDTAHSEGTCLFLHDFDNVRCFREAKSVLRKTWIQLLDEEIHVVVIEIESWYLAGLSPRSAAKIGISEEDFPQTNDVTKGVFLSLKPTNMTETEYYQLFLLHFDLVKARQRNRSLDRFLRQCIDNA
ncbi:MAG: hypothetical protein ABSG33_05495 [Candidatus Bathyarchaeia archaeon]